MNGDIAISTRAADMAASKGILVVNSAGNEGASAWQKIAAPSDGDSVLSVGAVDNMGVRASFSSKGNTADGRIKPDVCAQGVGAVLANSGGGFYGGNGTSFSCPIIAGMAACLWQYFPNITNMQLLEIIRQYSSNYNTPDSLLGYGIPNFSLAVQEIVSSALIKDDPIKSVFPTKFSNHINIIFHNSDTETISTKLINVHGEIIVERSFSTISNNNNLLSLDQLDVAQGMYTLVIQSHKQTLYRKVVCVK
jgi:subtilisin family serine protease